MKFKEMKKIILFNILIICLLKFSIAQKAPCGCEFFNLYYSYINYPCLVGDYVLVFEDNFDGNKLDGNKWQNRFPWGRHPEGYSDTDEFYTNGDNFEFNNETLKIIEKDDGIYAKGVDYLPDDYLFEDGLPNLRWWPYTSGMIYSKHSFYYGKYEIRCRMPEGAGFWPAFWIFGERGSEIDVFDEMFNNENEDIYYWKGGFGYDYNNNNEVDKPAECCGKMKYNLANFSDWHTFTLYFEPYDITIEIDNGDIYSWSIHRAYTQGEDEIACNTYLSPAYYLFRQAYPIYPMHIIANLAIHKGFSPPIDKRLEIDYIRYYKKTNCCQNVNILSYSDLNLNSDPDFYNFICGENIEINGSNITIQSDKKLDLVAKNEIVLLPGFTSEEGSDFLAKIDPSLYNKKSLNVASNKNDQLINYKIINNNDVNCIENINVKDLENINV